MPKKFGENTKAVEARLRKEEAKSKAAKEKQIKEEAELWKEDDKRTIKKLQRREDREQKKIQKSNHKKELNELAEAEMRSLSRVDNNEKITRASIQDEMAKQIKKSQTAKDVSTEVPILENLNLLNIDSEVARNVDDAIFILNNSQTKSVDRHPEKRMKSAYIKFEEENLERLKKEHPSMKLSQIKQHLRKEWANSPMNPFNKK